jgi:hypothetical protein
MPSGLAPNYEGRLKVMACLLSLKGAKKVKSISILEKNYLHFKKIVVF